MLRALITGGIGFIGANLSHRLLQNGHEVRIIDNVSRPGVEENLEWLRAQHGDQFEFLQGDVRTFEDVRDATKGVNVIFHLAAQVAVTTSVSNPREDFLTNAQGTLNVLEAARQLNPKPIFLYTSTNKVYGGLDHLRVVERETRYEFDDLPKGVSENCPLDFHSPYGCSKGAADQYVRDYFRIYGLRTIVFRMSCIYGPRQFGNEDQGWVAHFALTALRKGHLRIYGDGKQVRDLLYVDDLIELMLCAISKITSTAGQVYNVGGGRENTISVWTELRQPLERMLGKLPTVDYEEFRPGDQKIYVSDIRKACNDLGWRPKVGILDGLKRMIELWGGEWKPTRLR